MGVFHTIISGVGSNKSINRTNDVRGVAPTTSEFANPREGSSAKVRLSDDSIEFWDYTGGGWVLKFTDDDLSLIPEFNSKTAALVALGPNRKFRYSEINIDGVPSPDGTTTGITKN